MSRETMEKALRVGRSQLPTDRPGIIFVKVPQTWAVVEDEAKLTSFLREAVEPFLRNTGRVVSVVCHSSLVIDDGHKHLQRVLVSEIPNAKHRFDRSISWSMFGPMDRFPSSWITILDECANVLGD